MIRNLILVLFTLCFGVIGEAQDLYLIVGQSNAAGRGELPNNPQAMNGVKVLDDNGIFIDALPNLNEYSTIHKTTQTQGYNLGYTFGGEMHQHTGKEIRIVSNARGGTSIVHWFPGVVDDLPGNPYFDEAVARVQLALTNYPDSELKGILWHQGESNRNRSAYMSDLTELIGHFRDALGDVPFIVGQLSYERYDNATFNTNLTAITDLVDNTAWVSAEGLVTSDSTHFTADAQQTLGERYAAEMSEFLDASCGHQKTVYPISDTYALSGDTNGNFGTEDEIRIKKSTTGSTDRIGYIYFPSEATSEVQDYEQILLKLTHTGGATPNIKLKVLGNDFVDESVLTWSSQPTAEFDILYGGTSCGDEYYFDVTDYLQSTGSSNPGFKLITDITTTSTQRFGSKENLDVNARPQLWYFDNKAIDIPLFKINDITVSTIDEGNFESKRLNEKNNYKDSINQYGGLDNCSYQFNSTGFFRTEKSDGVWYIIDPDGNRFFSAGVNSVKEGGGVDAVQELKDIGVNTFGSWSDESYVNMPYCPGFNVLANYKNTDQRLMDMFVDNRILPVFEPDFQSWVQNAVVDYVQPYLNDKWVMGYFMDNELPFYKEQLFECLSYLGTNDPQYIEAENYMINKYGSAWNIGQITQENEDEYKGHVAETYYSIVAQAIKDADPNHLLLGTRINASAKYTPSVIEAAGNHTDILTINYYKVWEPEDDVIEMYDELTDVPWIVTEFYTKGEDSGLPNDDGAGWVVPSQEERVAYYENFVLKLMTDPNCVGYHWFRYQDDEGSNKGLLDLDYNWYEPMVESFIQLNEAKYALRDYQLHGIVNQECACESFFECAPSCVDIQLSAWLEGAYDPALGEMTTHLSSFRKLLPGQTPTSLLATPTPAGQPYSIAPWDYTGTEGASWTDADYTGDETDWVLASFRTGTAKSTEVGMTAGLLMKDGSVTFPDRCALPSTVTSPLYIVIEHRNHIGVMSPQPVDIIGSTLTYDFRLADSYHDATSFGQKQTSTGEWVIYAGDADQFDFPSFDINGQDHIFWFSNNGFFNYYLSPDFNLDGDITGEDKGLWFENNGITSRVPR